MSIVRDKDGLLTGIRILKMNSQVLKDNPIPSYLHIAGHRCYVSYENQTITCKYCDQPGHVQNDCAKHQADYPALKEGNIRLRKNNTLAPAVSQSAHNSKSNKQNTQADEVLDLSKPVNQPIIPAEMTENIILSAAEANEEPQEQQMECLEMNLDTITTPQQDSIDNWWGNGQCEVVCIKCQARNIKAANATELQCWRCKEDFQVVLPCCVEETS